MCSLHARHGHCKLKGLFFHLLKANHSISLRPLTRVSFSPGGQALSLPVHPPLFLCGYKITTLGGTGEKHQSPGFYLPEFEARLPDPLRQEWPCPESPTTPPQRARILQTQEELPVPTLSETPQPPPKSLPGLPWFVSPEGNLFYQVHTL